MAIIKEKCLALNRRGFTLVEILLVIAIIGILASTIYVGMTGQRQRARAHSSLESIRSALPYAVECYMKGDAPRRGAAGTSVCNPASSFDWPALADGCTYTTGAFTGDTTVANCGGGLAVRCNVEGTANCWIE